MRSIPPNFFDAYVACERLATHLQLKIEEDSLEKDERGALPFHSTDEKVRVNLSNR